MVHRSRWVTALVTVGSTAAAGLPAQQGPLRLARNTIFAEVSTLVVVGNASVNYERKINDMLSARVGVGMGVTSWPTMAPATKTIRTSKTRRRFMRP